MKRVIIDTDAGVDDTLALVYASRSPEIKVEMVTTVSGNVPVQEVTQNVLYLKKLLDWDTPVYSGAENPRARKLVTAPEVHGDDGVGNFRNDHDLHFDEWETGDAALRIVSAAKSMGSQLTIVSIGPMTNIAHAVAIDAEAMRGVGRIIQMGGVFSGYGNTGTHSEFNIFVDPEAADYVLKSSVKVDFVPLDLTEQLFLPKQLFEKLISKSKHEDAELTRLLKKSVQFYMKYHRAKDRLEGCFLHDPIAVAAAASPGWFKFIESSTRIETQGTLTSGMTIADLRLRNVPGNSRIAVAFDGTKFLRDFIMKVFHTTISLDSLAKAALRERFAPLFSDSLR